MVPDMCGMQDRQWRTSCYDPGLWIYVSCRRTSSSKDGNSANQRLFERQICTVFASVTQAAFEGLILRYPMNIDHSSFSFKFSGTFQHFWATSCHHFVREFDNFIYRCLRFIYFPSLHEGASASSSTLLVCPVLARREKWESGFPGFPCWLYWDLKAFLNHFIYHLQCCDMSFWKQLCFQSCAFRCEAQPFMFA